MTIFIYLLVCWILIGVFIHFPLKPEQKIAFIFLFMLFSLLNINFNYIQFEKLHRATYPRSLEKYFCLIVNRSMIVPMIILYTVYYFNQANTIKRKAIILFLGALFFGSFDFLGVLLKVKIYKGWNSFFSIFVYLSFSGLALVIKHWFDNKVRKGVTE